MRSKIKRLLKKYEYPPEGQKKALQYVIRQAELMSDQMSLYDMDRPVRVVT